jgi:glycerate dehydrogenase
MVTTPWPSIPEKQMKSVLLDYATMGFDDLDLSPLREVLPDIEMFDNTLPGERVERIRDAEVIFCNKVQLDAETLASAASVRFIGLTATGTDNVDLEFAKRNGIAVCNLVAYCTQSVVEHVVAVMLSLTHNLPAFHALVRDGDWARADNFCKLDYPLRQLSALTLGIVGYGELGKGVEKVARQFGMNVLIARRQDTKGHEGDGRKDFDIVLRESDVLTLHCPLNDRTQNLINAETLALMKADAILINTARGGLVDSAALADALSNGTIGAAAIDVLPQEPPADGDPLLDYVGNNLIITPHIAWATREARQAAIDELAQNYSAFVHGEKRNRVV